MHKMTIGTVVTFVMPVVYMYLYHIIIGEINGM